MMKSSAPLVFGFVLLFAFLLLLVAFRSIVVALKAILLNLLSVAAAYGMLVAVFQWGWGENLLDFNSTGGIASWLPMFLFVILFGLSMDYHVFILSRIREAFDRGLSTEDAVEYGIRTTAGVVTGASIVMVGVFGIFAILPLLDLKEMGIGLALAILIDATIIRAVLLPASMTLLGDRNWYLPKWLEWLPSLEHEAIGRAGCPRRSRARPRAGRLSPRPPTRTTQGAACQDRSGRRHRCGGPVRKEPMTTAHSSRLVDPPWAAAPGSRQRCRNEVTAGPARDRRRRAARRRRQLPAAESGDVRRRPPRRRSRPSRPARHGGRALRALPRRGARGDGAPRGLLWRPRRHRWPLLRANGGVDGPGGH